MAEFPISGCAGEYIAAVAGAAVLQGKKPICLFQRYPIIRFIIVWGPSACYRFFDMPDG